MIEAAPIRYLEAKFHMISSEVRVRVSVVIAVPEIAVTEINWYLS